MNIQMAVQIIPLRDSGLLIHHNDYYSCLIMYFALYWTTWILIAILGVIMIARLYAMYQRSRKVLVLLVVVYTAINIANTVILTIHIMHISAEQVVLSGTYHGKYYQGLFYGVNDNSYELLCKSSVLGPRLILGVREYHAKLVIDSDAGLSMISIAFQEPAHRAEPSSVSGKTESGINAFENDVTPKILSCYLPEFENEEATSDWDGMEATEEESEPFHPHLRWTLTMSTYDGKASHLQVAASQLRQDNYSHC
ncbi:hypothetical protein BDR03DRAFT_983836 [Suillus americanus]|nr:hypothetical protein BDR03DRAFT_983836 [Suillus americanus]